MSVLGTGIEVKLRRKIEDDFLLVVVVLVAYRTRLCLFYDGRQPFYD